jgi:hypothetical protein
VPDNGEELEGVDKGLSLFGRLILAPETEKDSEIRQFECVEQASSYVCA